MNMDDGFDNTVYIRAKLKNKMDFRVIKVIDLEKMDNQHLNSMFISLNEYKSHFKNLANHKDKDEIVNCRNYFFGKSKLSSFSCSKLYFILDDFNCNLRDLIEIRREKTDPYSETMILTILKDVLEGINYMQRVGLCHRNLRPENICFSHRKAKYMINNLNLSSVAKNRFLDQVSLVGCLIYMPIEIVTNLASFDSKLCFKIDHEKFDIYSLAVIIIELISFKLVCRDLLESNAFYLFMRI